MNGKKARAERRAAAAAQAPPARRRWRAPAVGIAVVALVAASFVTPKLFDSDEKAAPRQHTAAHELGVGLAAGASVPAFEERDLISGETISSESVEGGKTLLFFSEGVMCQACFVQIRDIEQVGDELGRRGIDLISITPDPPDVLRQAIGQYGIGTPMIADDDRDMSAAFDTLGRGMHPDTPGHAFVLVDERGAVVWHRDYWLEPDRTMYVDPERLLADIPAS